MMKLLANIGIGAVWALLDNVTDHQLADLWGFLAGITATLVTMA